MHYYLLALIAGTVLTTQVAINGKLLSYLGSPVLTSLISFAVGTLGLAVAYIIAVGNGLQPVPALTTVTQTNIWMWLGGLLGAFYIFTTILCSPKIGFANMFSLIITGQIILALIFDHFGVLGSPLHAISPLRAAGAVLLIGGVYLIQTH